MHICIITSSFPANKQDARAAAGLFVKDFCLALVNLGHRVTVVTPEKTPKEKENIPGIEVHWYPWLGGGKTLSTMKPYLPHDALAMLSLFRRGRRALDALVAKDRFDHVMAMWAVPAGYLAMGLKKRHGIPFTTWCLGSDIWTYGTYPILRKVVAKVLNASDYIFADGLKLGEDAQKLSGRACPFLPTSRGLKRNLIKPLDLNDGFRFLFIGRYAQVKGVDVLLEAMARFRAAGHAGHLYMFGGGPLDDEVRSRAEEPDLRDCVTVGGYADDETFISYMNACDCFLIPSRMESIPVVLSDAAQMGKPVIVSDVGDMGLLLRETPAGLVVPAEDSDALCGAMAKMAATDTAVFAPHVAALAGRFDVAETAKEWAGRIINS
jgi:glycosyltransferase involved in cell wall biosynthesis